MADLVKDLMKHIDTAKQAYIKSYTAIDAATLEHNKNITNLKSQANELTEEAYSKKWSTEQTEYKQKLSKINAELTEEIEKVGEAYLKTLYAYYQPSGDAIIDDDVKLLNSGIILSGDEVERMVAKNADNTTMLRLIGQYRINNKIKVSQDVENAFIRAGKAGEAEKHAFITFTQLAGNCVRMALQGMAGSGSYIKCADKLEEYIEETETKLKKAKVFLDEATKAELEEIKKEKIKEKQNRYSESDIDYLH